MQHSPLCAMLDNLDQDTILKNLGSPQDKVVVVEAML